MNIPQTNYKDSNNVDLGQKLVTKDYLITVYPGISKQLGITPQIYTWGNNYNGQLGINNSNTGFSTNTPTSIYKGEYAWKQVNMGSATPAVAIRNDNTIWTWGQNTVGQLGLGNYINSTIPIQITFNSLNSPNSWKRVEGGSNYILAINSDSSLWAWGYNTYGCLGIGLGIGNTNLPTQVGTDLNWRQISAGFYMSAGIRTDGTLWTWGLNDSGQLGTGNIGINTNKPSKVGTGTNWKQVSCYAQTLAIKTDGTLWAWGLNNYGQLGNSTTTDYSSPIQISGTTWSQVSCGSNHTLAIKTDGTLWAWGGNDTGQLGINNLGIGGTYSPTQVGNSVNWKQVSCGNLYTLAIKTDGTLWAWGRNSYGQLGIINNNSNITTPTQVGTSNNWKQISAGDYTSIGLQSFDFI